MHTVKAQRSAELFVKNILILPHHFAALDLETADWSRLTKLRNDYNKFVKKFPPEISKLTTVVLCRN